MKKIYIPSDDVLQKMQELGVNTAKYMTIKSIEMAILTGLKKKSILKNASDEIINSEDAVNSICSLYPREIAYSHLASRNEDLLDDLIMSPSGMKLEGLEYLGGFEEDIQYVPRIARQIIKALYEELKVRPQYRFEYKESRILDDIFGMDIANSVAINDYVTENCLARIDPAYAVLIPNVSLVDLSSLSYATEASANENERRKTLARYGMISYSERYKYNSMEDMISKEDISREKENVKRLAKTIRKNKRFLY